MGVTGDDVLFLAHRIPWPPDRGDSIRSWQVLRALAAQRAVHCGCLVDAPLQPGQREAINAVTASRCIAARPPLIGLPAVAALVTGRPISVAAFASRYLAGWVRRTLAERPIGTIYVFSGQMAQYVPAEFTGRVVMDFVDVDSAKFAAYARGPYRWPIRAIHAREARVLAAFEARAAERANLSLLISAEERELLLANPGLPASARVEVLGNGIDCDRFDPAVTTPAPLPAGAQIVFTGQMDYPPNVDAVARFAREVMPLIRAQRADAAFHVVGRAPAAEVRALHGVNATNVTGEVPDVRPWLAAADCVVAPLQIARGVQNKVLEAMAMARAVVLSAAAATGIGGTDGVHFAIADEPVAMAARVLGLLDDRAAAAAMGTAARALVRQEAGWDRVVARLPAIMGWDHGA